MDTIIQPRQRGAIFSIVSATSRKRGARLLLVATLMSLAFPALGQVAVTEAWVRGTVAGQKVTGAFMQLKSPTDTALIAVTTPIAKIAEIHEMKHEGGMMKMNAVDKVALPAGKVVELQPGGYHVMLMELAKPLTEGETVPLELTFQDKAGKKQTLEVKAVVKPLTAGAGTARTHK